jgi:hypothetical protein
MKDQGEIVLLGALEWRIGWLARRIFFSAWNTASRCQQEMNSQGGHQPISEKKSSAKITMNSYHLKKYCPIPWPRIQKTYEYDVSGNRETKADTL